MEDQHAAPSWLAAFDPDTLAAAADIAAAAAVEALTRAGCPSIDDTTASRLAAALLDELQQLSPELDTERTTEMPRSKRDDVTPLTVTVLNEQGQPTTEIKVKGWSSANAVVSTYEGRGQQTQVTPRTD